MALFKNRGQNHARATAILSKIAPKEEGAEEGKTQEQLDQEAAAAQAAQEAADAAAAQAALDADNDNDNDDDSDNDSGSDDDNDGGGSDDDFESDDDDNDNSDADDGAAGGGQPGGTNKPEVDVTEELLLEKLGERLGRKIESFDDLKPREIDPEVQQLLDWKEKTGLSLSQWADYNKDFGKMGDLDVAREILSREYPNFTKEELEYSLKKFVYDEEKDDEEDRLKKSIKLKEFAKEGRDKLEAKKLELKPSAAKEPTLTEEQKNDLTFAQKFKAQMVKDRKAQQDYDTGIKTASQKLDAIDLTLSEKYKIKFNVPGEVKKSLPKTVAEMPHWYNKDGSYNHANVVNDVAKVVNFDAMIQAAFEQGVNVGKEGMIKKSANITLDKVPVNDNQKKSKSNVQDVVDSITGGKRNLRFGKRK